MDPRYDIPQRAAGSGRGSANSSPALGAQSRRRKMPPRPADFKLQIIIIGSRGVGKTSLMERFTDDTFCEACKSTVGEERWCLRVFGLSAFYWQHAAGLRLFTGAKKGHASSVRTVACFNLHCLRVVKIVGVVNEVHKNDTSHLAQNTQVEFSVLIVNLIFE